VAVCLLGTHLPTVNAGQTVIINADTTSPRYSCSEALCDSRRRRAGVTYDPAMVGNSNCLTGTSTRSSACTCTQGKPHYLLNSVSGAKYSVLSIGNAGIRADYYTCCSCIGAGCTDAALTLSQSTASAYASSAVGGAHLAKVGETIGGEGYFDGVCTIIAAEDRSSGALGALIFLCCCCACICGCCFLAWRVLHGTPQNSGDASSCLLSPFPFPIQSILLYWTMLFSHTMSAVLELT
jgi:hypothetical protein